MPPTRRLFQSHLSRRPASAVPSSSSSSNSSINVRNNTDNNIIPPTDPNDNNPLAAEAVHMGISNFTTPSLLHPQSSSTSAAPIIDDGEIIARDKNGGFQLDIPVLPPIPLDEEDEEGEEEDEDEGAMEGIEEGVGRHSAGSGGSNAANGSVMGSELVGRDKESKSLGILSSLIFWNIR